MRQLKDVIHYYLGCEIWSNFNNRVERLRGVVPEDEFPIKTQYKRATWCFEISEVKPILRRLEDITNEHSKEAVQIAGYTPDEMTAKHFRKRLKEWGLHICQFVPLINYLRSKGYDCDGLIESGEAIDAKTLNEKK